MEMDTSRKSVSQSFPIVSVPPRRRRQRASALARRINSSLSRDHEPRIRKMPAHIAILDRILKVLGHTLKNGVPDNISDDRRLTDPPPLHWTPQPSCGYALIPPLSNSGSLAVLRKRVRSLGTLVAGEADSDMDVPCLFSAEDPHSHIGFDPEAALESLGMEKDSR